MIENRSPEPVRDETRTHLAFLDGWRGLAIGLVLLGHFLLDDIHPGFSTLGVDLFFVLSGRLMADILFVQNARLPTFFVRRFSRVYPALLFYVITTTIALRSTPYRQGLLADLTALTFTLNYAMIYGHPVAALDHLWSLCVEEHSYLILAVVAVLVRRRSMSAATTIVVIGCAALVNGIVQSGLLHKHYFDVFWRSDVQIASLFLSGFLYLHRNRLTVLRYRWTSPVSLVGAILLKLFASATLLSFGLGTILLAASAVSVDFSFESHRRLLSTATMRQLGLWSYSIYLWQQPFYKMSRDDVAPAAILVAMVAVPALLSFYLVERPARGWINNSLAALPHQ